MRKPSLRRQPLFRLLAINAAGGALLGCGFAAALVGLDVSRIGSLIAGAETPWVPIFLLFGGFAITFASVTTGTAVMAIGRDPRPSSGSRAPAGLPVPVRAAGPVGPQSSRSFG